MKVTEQHLINLDECVERLDAVIEDINRPTIFSLERLVEWLKTNPKVLRSAIVDHRHELELEFLAEQAAIEGQLQLNAELDKAVEMKVSA
jgi:hypothetical protein